MSERDRQPSGSATQAARSASGVAPSAASDPRPPAAPSWEAVYRACSPRQQRDLLALADRQGLLYAHQLPKAGKGPSQDEARPFLAHLLSGKATEFEPVRVPPVEDAGLHPTQCEAVAKALATPDLCLILGLPVTGKSRVVAEIAARAVQRGERVLLVSAQSASVDRVLELLDDNEQVSALRYLAREEDLANLPPVARSRVPAERVRRLHEQALQTAITQVEEAEQQQAALSKDAAHWPHLLELAERHEQLDEQCAALGRRRDSVPDAVAAAAGRALVSLDRQAGDPTSTPGERPTSDDPFEAEIVQGATALEESRRRLDSALAETTGRIQASKETLARLNAQQAALAPLAEAKAGKRWWKPAWWRAVWTGDVAGKAAALQVRVQQAQDDLASSEAEQARFITERRQVEEKERLERASCVEREIARRLGELDAADSALAAERALLASKWRETLSHLDARTPRAEATTVASVRVARAAWQQILESDAKRRALLQDWAEQLGNGPQALAEEVRAGANLVACTLACLVENSSAAEARETIPTNFDLLLVDHAEHLAEADFLAAARRCRRWVLVAEALSHESVVEPPPQPPKPSGMRSKVERRKARPQGPTLFQRLWSRLHCAPCRLPYLWAREADGRLCCRLRAVPDEQRRWVETERVADFPDIELRIVAPPRGARAATFEPFLAEVVFPPSLSVLDAKAYIFRELQEVPVRAGAACLHWQELPDRVRLQLTDPTAAGEQAAVPLSPGVRELVAFPAVGPRSDSDNWCTAALEFERSAGWTRDAAEQWVAHHLALGDLGRTAILDVRQGIAPGLAMVLSDILFAGDYKVEQSAADAPTAGAVEFVAVPSLPRPAHRGERRRGRLPAGAGLEADLTDARQRDRLPQEWHAKLTGAHGYVNYLEAQAVIRALSRLAHERSGRATPDAALTRNGVGGHPLLVGVIALHSAQAQLIRLLLEPEREVLAAAGLEVAVDVPLAFRERECAVALVSLTRSHTHRAVSFGDGPLSLATAVTRGRGKLVLFGDAGTLARRAEWQGPLDHLDELDSAQERAIIARLVQYLQGGGIHRHLFHVRHDGSAPIHNRAPSVRAAPTREGSNA